MKKFDVKKYDVRKLLRRTEKSFNSLFILITAAILLITIIIMAVLAYVFNVTEFFTIYLDQDLGWFMILILIVSSITVGLAASYGFGQIIIKPMKRIVKGMTELSDGNYDEKIDLGSRNFLKELSDCYNKLAQELKSNEMMSTDFINNFSHELKTPLASITGLVSLMKQPNFPESKRLEYLSIIEEEAKRLSDLTTNILNLSKLENQEILKDQEQFNLSEQIRTCVLLLDEKWTKKNIDFVLDFEEINFVGSIDLLKQVWFNLIDNAIKFSYDNKPIIINIIDEHNCVIVEVINEGDELSEEEISKIFYKFYQGNNKIDGNGIGLSIVKKIVDLHNGKINVESKEHQIKFIIKLPK